MLDKRAQILLKTLVENYINDGQPVGSRTLSERSGLDLSPATIRNAMADLESMGFIASPHTSAGRIPTQRGYRFFVDTLLTVQPMQNQEIQRITRLVSMESALLTVLTGIVVSSACVVLYSHLPGTYLAAIWPLAILMVGRLIQGSLGPGPAVMTLRGRHIQLGWIVGSAIATEVALIYLLAPVMGTVGLATASAVGLILYSVAVRVYIKRMSHGYNRAQS